MWAMGLLPEEALSDGFAGPNWGSSVQVSSALWPGCDGLAVGDRVMAFAPGFVEHAGCDDRRGSRPIPPETSFAEAATIPVTFVTAIYALGHLAKLVPGEHVLIHTASGGVGLAAIQYAKQRGAVVIATAGSEVKRAFLPLAGADCVFYYETLPFAMPRASSPRGKGSTSCSTR